MLLSKPFGMANISKAGVLMSKIESKSKCDIVTDSIINEIVGGIYPVGSKLPTENELCDIYGVSRITIRESLNRLSSMGLITIQQGRGTFVSNINVGTFMSPLLPLIEFDDMDFMTIYNARLFIEKGTCRLAARNRTEEDIVILNRYLDQMEKDIALGDIPHIVDFDTRFHVKIAEMSGNSILKACVINLERITKASVMKFHKVYSLMDEANVQHRKIALAIEQMDEDAAERAIVEHTLKAQAFQYD